MPLAAKAPLAGAGPWKYARYPNYGGEILQWWGLWLLSIAVLSGAYWVCIISPLFLMCLLLFVSGVPLQEKQACHRGPPRETGKTHSISFSLLGLMRCLIPFGNSGTIHAQTFSYMTLLCNTIQEMCMAPS